MNKAEILSALQQGKLNLEGQFVYGSNFTFMASCQLHGQVIKAVYKPLKGERPLYDFPGQTLARREVAAYLVSEALNWNFVPPTILRNQKAPLGPGSLQIFIDHDPEVHYFNFSEKDKAQMPRVMLFDLLINNADRKAGHLLIDSQGELWLIDHGLSFHVEDKLRTVIWDHAGELIPTPLLKNLQDLVPALAPEAPLFKALQPHLDQVEIEALKSRAVNLLESGEFPLPPEDRRAYPWPLV